MGEATRQSWGLMQRREYAGAARIVTVVELHVTYYSPRAWACYQKLLDPALNWGGYGYDNWLQNYMVDHCALRKPIMGILDGYTATHYHLWFRKQGPRPSEVAARRPRAQWFFDPLEPDARHAEGYESARHARAECQRPLIEHRKPEQRVHPAAARDVDVHALL